MYSQGRGYCNGSVCTYSYQDGGIQWQIYGITLPADVTKTLESITLPSTQYEYYFRLFSITLGP